jgi:hypothetical protein
MIISIIGFLQYQMGVEVSPPAALGSVAVWIIGMLLGVIVFLWRNGETQTKNERDKWAAVLAERQAMCDKERERDELRSREMYDLLKSEIAKRDERALKQQDILEKLSNSVEKLAQKLGVEQ